MAERWRRIPVARPGYQRHHILPRALLARAQFADFFTGLARTGFRFDDFARNGIFLPDRPAEARASGLALHCGPHPRYNEVVLARVERIRALADDPGVAIARIGWLQAALRRTLDGSAPRWIWLNRRDPMWLYADCVELDAMIADMFPD